MRKSLLRAFELAEGHLKHFKDQFKIEPDSVAAQLTQRSVHQRFNESSYPPTEKVFQVLEERRFKQFALPKLLKHSKHWSIADHLPVEEAADQFKVSMRLSYAYRQPTGNEPKRTAWIIPMGQNVNNLDTHSSPEVTINTFDASQTRYFTLAMVDLDFIRLETKSFEEWCHWLVTDIPVKGECILPSIPSPFFGEKFVESVGNTVFGYVPPIPTFANPRQPHRYCFALFEQEAQRPLAVDLAALKHKAQQERLEYQKTTKPSYLKAAETENDISTLMTRERFLVFPAMRFAKQHSLSLASFCFVTASWTPQTSATFTALGIHEPVYGRQEDDSVRRSDQIKKLHHATQQLSSLNLSDHSNIDKIPLKSLDVLNKGQRPSFKSSRILQQDGVAPETTATNQMPSQTRSRRLTEIAATALVRNKASDIASKKLGDATETLMNRRSRYLNR